MTLSNNKMAIGTIHLPDRKNPCLVVLEGSDCFVYGTMSSEENADAFMRKLQAFMKSIGAVICVRQDE